MTVAIVGILAAIAIPQYGRTVERGYWQAAQDVLLTVYAGEQTFFTVNNQYQPIPLGSPMAMWRTIFMDDPNTPTVPVTYNVATNGLQGNQAKFTATAIRNGGLLNGSAITIDQNRTMNLTNWPRP